MKKCFALAIGAAATAFLAGTASADIVIMDASSSDWAEYIASQNKRPKHTADFGQLADMAIIGFAGPLTSAGSGPVPAGFIKEGHSLNSSDPNHAGNELVGVGPSAGFGNPKNVVAANFFVDSFQLDISNNTAIEIEVWSFLGSNTVDVSAGGASGNFANGARVGIGTTDGSSVGLVDVFDAGGGAEGIMSLTSYEQIPAPGALALLGVAGLAARRRRRA